MHTHASVVTHPRSGTSEETQTLIYSCAVSCLLNVYLLLRSQTRAAERSPVEEGSEQR